LSVESAELNVERFAPRGAVFLSYASQDAEAAKRICDSLRAAGVEVWFDQSELVGGDAWDQKIRKQIRECALVIPVISKTTQARREAYFRLEWKLADERTHLMAKGTPFLLPVTIDETGDRDALVPDSFVAIQWTKAPGGEVPLSFCARVKNLLEGNVRASLDDARGRAQYAPLQDRGGASRRGPSKWWWVLPIFGVTMALVLVLKEHRREVPAVGESLSPARQLTERARAILDQGSLTRAQLDAAGELCDKALQLDSTDALVLARAASVDLELIYPYGYDRSEERRRRARERAAKATSLAPDQFEVKLVQARVFAHAVGTPALLKEAEKMFRELLAQHPEDRKVVVEFAEVLREQKRFDEAAGLFKGIGEFQIAAWSYYQGGKLRAAQEALEHSPRSVTGLLLRARLKVIADEDLAAAQAQIDQLQPSDLLAEMPAAVALDVAMYRRDPARVLEIAQGLTQDYLLSNAFRGPRQFYTGLAHELAGRSAAAESEWRAGLAVIQARLKTAPDDGGLLLWSAWLHAALKEPAEAERLLARYQALAGLAGDTLDESNAQVLLRLRHKEAVLAGIEALFRDRRPNWEGVHAEMRFSPEVDWLRGDPRFEKLLRDNLPPGAKPLDNLKTEDRGQTAEDRDQTSHSLGRATGPGSAAPRQARGLEPVETAADIGKTTPPVADAKSVAVLAFANLSDDKANEYFSDGISEELLNVLAKVPGLKVTARTSSFHFKGKDTPIPEIARQLGVAYVVEGSVRKQGDKVRITAQLIKAADGFQVWSDTFTRELKDIFAVQDEIAGLVAKNLQVEMGVVTPAPAVDPEAFRLLLAGRAKIYAGGFANLDQAIGEFRRAVEIAPGYAIVWAELARAFVQQARSGTVSLDVAFAEARAAAQRAVTLAPDLPEAWAALGWVRRTVDWDWRGAEQAFRRALVPQPNRPRVMADAALLLNNIGRIDESIRLGERAAELDPLNADAFLNLFLYYGNADRLEDAVRAARRAVELAPHAEHLHRSLSNGLADLGRFEEAAREAELEPNELQRLEARAFILLRQGRKAEALRLAQPLEDSTNGLGFLSELYALAGETDRAFATLERAYALRQTGLPWLKVDVYYNSLHADPRWPVLLRKLGLADDQLK